jgi:insertion element IS1 protein InsB
MDTASQQPVFVPRKRSLDRFSTGRAVLAACHCAHLQGSAHHRARGAQKKSQAARLNFPHTLLPAIAGDALEIDELVIRFRYKRHYRYLWLAISRLTRQVVGFYIGDRSTKSLQCLWFSLPADYRRKLVYSDFYEAYAKWFALWQHRPSDKGSGKTSVVEGLNNKWRNRISELVRKTVCVRYIEDLERRLWLVLQGHNQLCLQQLAKLVPSTH